MEEYRITVTYIDNSDDYIKLPTLKEALMWLIRNAANIADCLIARYYKDDDDRFFKTTGLTWFFDREDLIGEDAYYQEIVSRKER